jgi:hypothetical protein
MGKTAFQNNGRLLFGLILACGLASGMGCTRKVETSKLSLSVPKQMTSHKVGALTVAMDVQHLIINVSGPGMTTIFYVWDSHRCAENSVTCAPPDPIVIPEVPNGNGRLVQVLEIFGQDGENDGEFFYGDTPTPFTVNGATAVNIEILPFGTSTDMAGGSIAGRYYGAGGVFPTGVITTKFLPPGGRPPMIVDKNEIFSGWFSTFILKNFPLLYEVEGFGPLFGGPVSADTITASSDIMKIDVPDTYRNWGGPEWEHDSTGTLIIGKFGDAGVTIPAMPEVCKNSDPHTYQYQFDSIMGSPLSFPSGFSFSSIPECSGADDFIDFMTFHPDMHDRQGRESAAAIKGPFMAAASINGFLNTPDSTTVDWEYLPGIDSSVIDGVKLFAKAMSGGGSHDEYRVIGGSGINCPALPALGFQLLATVPVTASIATVNLSSISSGVLIACPYKGATLYTSAAETWIGGGGGGGGPMAKIGFRGGAMVSNDGYCSEVDLALLDANGYYTSPTNNPTGVSVDLSASGPGTITFKDGGCSGSPSTTVFISSNMNSKRIGIEGSGVGTYALSATSASPALPTDSPGNIFSVAPTGAVTRIEFTDSGGAMLTALGLNVCKAIKMKFYDNFSSQNTWQGTVFPFQTYPGVTYYAGNACGGAAIGSISVAGGQPESPVFSVKVSQSGWANLSTLVSSYYHNGSSYALAGMFGLPVGGLTTPVYLTVNTTPSPPLTVGSCYELHLTARNYQGTATAVSGGLPTVDITITGGDGYLYNDSACTPAGYGTKQVSFASGSSVSSPVYIKANSTAGGYLYVNGMQSGSGGFNFMLYGYSNLPVVP